MIFKKKKKKYFFSLDFFNKIKYLFKNISAIIVIIQLLLAALAFYFYYSTKIFNSYPLTKILSEINILQKKATGFDFQMIDEYFIVTFKGIRSNIKGNKLENLKLNINHKNLIILEKQRLIRQKKVEKKNNSELTSMVSANLELIDKKKNFKIRLRVKGVRPLHHYDKDYQSYKVDVRGDQRIFGYEEFNLQKPITRNYIYEYIFHKLQKEVGNISLDYFFVNLETNGIKNGVYAIEEALAKELIERHKKRFGPIINTDDRTGEKFPLHSFEARDRLYWQKNNPIILKNAFSILNNFRESDRGYENSLDWKKWANFFAVNDLLGTYHGSMSSSVNYYYNPVNGKIEPIGRDAHYGSGNFEKFMILDFLTEEQPICSWICDQKNWYMKFFYKQSSKKEIRDEFIKEYLKTLKKLSSDKFLDEFFKKYNDEIIKINDAIYGDFSKTDKIFWLGLAPHVFSKEPIYKRSLMIRDKIYDYDKFSINKKNFLEPKISINKNVLYFDSSEQKIPIKIEVKCLDNNKTFQFYASGRFKKIFEECTGLDGNIVMFDLAENNLQKDIKNDFSSLYFDKNFNYRLLPNILDLFNFKKIGNSFFLSDEKIIINENIYIPKDINIKILEGKKIVIQNDSTIFSEANLFFIGTKEKKIMIKNIDNNGGSLVQIGGTFMSENLEVNNLSQPQFDQFILYGGINIIESKVKMKDTYILNSKGEDGINLFNSNSVLKNIKIINSNSDGVDIDGGKLSFSQIECIKIKNDCLDISGSNFKGKLLKATNIGDKALSLGEKSTGDIKELFVKSANIGVAVKDLSSLNLEKLSSEDINIEAAVFIKKNEFGPAELFIKKYDKLFEKKNFLIGKKSKFTLDKTLILGSIKNKKIRENLYIK